MCVYVYIYIYLYVLNSDLYRHSDSELTVNLLCFEITLVMLESTSMTNNILKTLLID